MNEEKKPQDNYIHFSTGELDKLFGHGDGNAALLYLYVRRTGGFSLGRAARELKCTEAELLSAAETLRSLGLLSEKDAVPARRVDAAPEYTAEDVAARTGADPAFEAVVAEAEFALGRVLSSSDLKLLFAIYDYWGLQPDVIMELLHHCVEKYQARNGTGRTPTMRYVEKEAQFWARNEITTLDAVEEYIRREKSREALTGQIKDMLQIRGRELTNSELGYIDTWLQLGFGPDALAIAYDRTVLSTGRLTWKYMDRIVHSWNEKGLYTPEAIEAGDSRRAPARSGAAPAPETRSDHEKLETMRRMYAHIKGRS